MKLLLHAVRVLCLALLLPQLALAPAGAAMVSPAHDCCPETTKAATTGKHVHQTSETVPPGDHRHGHHAFDCGLHHCGWIAGSGAALIGPAALGWLSYAPGAAETPPAARAESLHRPPDTPS